MRPRYVVGAAVLALGLFAAGALGPWGGSADEPEVSTAAASDDALLAPIGRAESLDETIASLQAFLAEGEPDGRSYALLGLAYLQKGRITADPSFYSKAQAAFESSLELQPAENFEAFIGMGTLALGRHQFDVALRWGQQARELDPFDSQVYGVIGDAEVELGHYRRALKTFQKMVDTRPDLSSYARVSYMRELLGDTRGALVAMKQAYAAAGTPEDAAWSASHLGDLYRKSGHPGLAMAQYQLASEHAPDYPEPSVGIARIEASRGRLAEAIEVLAPVVERFPAIDPVIVLGDIYALAGRDEDAEAQYELVDAIDELYRSNGANTDLEMTLFLADHDRGAAALKRARAEYERRHSVHVADALAWSLYAVGRYEEADRFSRLAFEQGTREPLFFFHAGMIAAALGDDERARTMLKSAIAMDRSFSLRMVPVALQTLRGLKGDA